MRCIQRLVPWNRTCSRSNGCWSFATIVAILSLTALVLRASITSSFDSDADGWTVTGGTSVFVSTGGNPGGFLQVHDTTTAALTAFAPSKFLGNLTAYDFQKT